MTDASDVRGPRRADENAAGGLPRSSVAIHVFDIDPDLSGGPTEPNISAATG